MEPGWMDKPAETGKRHRVGIGPGTGASAFRLLNVIVIAGVISWWSLFFVKRWAARRLVMEDSLVEWGQFLLLIAAGLCCLIVVRGYRRYYGSPLLRISFLVLCLLSFFVAGEEISWGQRLLGFATPEGLAEVSVQDEFNVHNLEFVHRFRHWLLILFGGVGLGLILRGGWRTKLGRGFSAELLPDRRFALLFFVILVSGLFLEATY